LTTSLQVHSRKSPVLRDIQGRDKDARQIDVNGMPSSNARYYGLIDDRQPYLLGERIVDTALTCAGID
jgi:hypothetical protein